MIEREKVAAMILVGGKSRRMNYQDKMNLKLGNCTFLERIKECITIFEARYISVSKQQQVEVSRRFLQEQIIVDQFDNIGPIGGIYSVMKAINYPTYLLVLSCDMPFITVNEILTLIQQCVEGNDAYVAIVNHKIQPLFALYHTTVQDKIYQQIVNGEFRIIDLYSKIKVQYLDLGEQSGFYNINTLEQLEQARIYLSQIT